MNIEEQRKAFESWFESRYYAHFMQFALDLDLYVDKHTQTCWEAWLASANREGYKLVPVELIKSCNDIAVDCFNKWDIKKEAMPDICELMQDFSYYLQSHDRSL